VVDIVISLISTNEVLQVPPDVVGLAKPFNAFMNWRRLMLLQLIYWTSLVRVELARLVIPYIFITIWLVIRNSTSGFFLKLIIVLQIWRLDQIY
jgi:hypothetical protein